MNIKKAVSAIEEHGILLVYPIDNRKEPQSLWSSFFPRSEMRWEWDSGGDDRVARLWHLREELSRSGKVVYAKWFRGRATLFSHEVFAAMLAALGTARGKPPGLTREARGILEVLESDSPLSTKRIKAATDLRGRGNERVYEKAMKELWDRLLLVGYGEIDDGAFPSLAVGATRVLFEDDWNAASGMSRTEGVGILNRRLGPDSLWMKQFAKILRSRFAETESRNTSPPTGM